MRTINELETKLNENKLNFLIALKNAGYTDNAINNSINDNNHLLEMANEIYNDLWDAFNKEAFENTLNF